MTVRRYAIEEAVERIYRLFRGDTLSDDTPGSLQGTRYPVDESVSRLTEILQNSLPGETATLPSAVNVSAASLPDAINHRYGEIFFVTGSLVSINVTETWVKVTGAFAGNGLYSDGVTVNAQEGKITVTSDGTWIVGYEVFISGNADEAYGFCVAKNGVIQPPTICLFSLDETASKGFCSAESILTSSGTTVFELYANGGNTSFSPERLRLYVYNLPIGTLT